MSRQFTLFMLCMCLSCGALADVGHRYGDDDGSSTANSTKVYCKDVHQRNSSQQCFFIGNTSDCEIAGGFVSYLNLPYCQLTGKWQPVAVVILLLWLLYLFLAIGVTVEHFLCPALSVISNTLGLSESVAGVTFLAFGNGAADIFSLFVLITTGDGDAVRAETGMGAILGGGLFVTTVVVGLIAFNYPLQIKMSTFLRDVAFYTAAISWLMMMLSDGKITQYEAVGYIALYATYVITVIVMLKVSQQREKRLLPEDSERRPLLDNHDGHGPKTHGSTGQATRLDKGSLSGSYTTGNFTGSIAGGSIDWRMASDGSMLKSQTSDSGAVEASPADANQPAATNTTSAASTTVPGAAHSSTDSAPQRPAPLHLDFSGSDASADFTGNIAGGSVDWQVASDGSLLPSSAADTAEANPGAVGSTGTGTAAASVAHPSRDALVPVDHANAETGAAPATVDRDSSAASKAGTEHSQSSRSSASSSSPVTSPWMKLMDSLCPYSVADFKTMNWLGRVMLILRAPIRLVLTITVAVILPTTNEEQARQQWNKYLLATNCLIAPIFGTLAMDLFFHEIRGAEVIFVGVISCAVGVLLFLLVAIFTSPTHPPFLRPAFSFLGFLMSVVWIYMIANEVVNILDTFGVVLELNGAFLGLIVLAGGNSVCDLVANFLVAKSGKAEMAVAACYGSPLLNMLIGVGLSATITTFRDDAPYELQYTTQLKLASGVLLAGLAFATSFVILTKCTCGWQAGRAFAIPLFAGYVSFLVAEIALEFA